MVGPASRRDTRHKPFFALTLAALAASVMAVAPAGAVSRRKVTVNTEQLFQTPAAPRTILVSIRKQRLRLLDGDREIASSRISSGQPGFDTPTGVFSILEKRVYHESNIYEGAPMPHMQRITWSGIAMHAGVVPGYRASHGCVRLPASFAKSFFEQTEVGGRVIITQDEVSPVRFEHANLFKPLPENDPPTATSAPANTSEPKVAANDPAEAARAALSLVSPANAASEVAPPPPPAADKPRSRADLARRLTEKLQGLQATLAKAEERKLAAGEKAKLAVRAAQDAEAKLAEVRRPFEDVLRAAANAERARAEAAANYRDFLNQSGLPPQKAAEERDDKDKEKGKSKGKSKTSRSKQPDPEQSALRAMPPEDQEQELEERLLDAVVEVESHRRDAAGAEAAIAEAKAAFAARDAERQKALDEVRDAITDLRRAQTALVDAKAEAVRRNKSLSIFISLKTARLYIRQGFEPIFETPIEVDNPGTIGTHVFTALGYDETGNNFVWQLVTAQQPRLAANVSDEERTRASKKKRNAEGDTVSVGSPLAVEAARAALDSITIPPDVQEQIAELAKPGTSLIISEKELSRETGKGTEFILLTR